MAAGFTDQIRDAIRNCGLSRYAISKATGIDQSMLARFISGQHGLSPTSLDALAKFLGLKVHGGRFPTAASSPSRPTRNVDSFRVRCVNNVFDSVITEFPRVGFKQWEAEEREQLSRERGEQVKLAHYRLDSPLGRKHLPPELRREYGVEQSEEPNGITQFVLRLNNGAGQEGWFFARGGDTDNPRGILSTENIALAQKWRTQADARRAIDRFVSSGAISHNEVEVEEIAAPTSFSLTVGEGEWPDAIEVLDEGGSRTLLVRDSSEETSHDLDQTTADILLRVLAKLKEKLPEA
jgi:transcriptional regulator with XRE-family HTH domain